MPGAGRIFFRSLAASVTLAAAILLAAGCGDDDVDPPTDDDPLKVVRTAAELDTAFRTVSSGDTIEIDGGFSGGQFVMTQGYVFEAESSPFFVRSTSRSIRPEIVFPSTADGLTFVGHEGTRLTRLSIRGGRTSIVLRDARVLLDTLEIRAPARDGVEAMGVHSSGRIRGSLIELPGRFGVFTGDSAPFTVDKNTIADAGDCGMHIGSNCTVRNNLVVGAGLHGLYFDDLATSPTVICNDAFQNGTNYGTASDIGVPGDNNYAVDPRFCPSSYRLRSNSPLTAANAGSCGLIGAFDVEEGCENPPE